MGKGLGTRRRTRAFTQCASGRRVKCGRRYRLRSGFGIRSMSSWRLRPRHWTSWISTRLSSAGRSVNRNCSPMANEIQRISHSCEGYTVSMKKWIIPLALLGFFGAGLFYSPYLGLDAGSRIACPLCPHITVVNGSRLARYLNTVLVFGSLNSILLIAAVFLVLKISRALSAWRRPGRAV